MRTVQRFAIGSLTVLASFLSPTSPLAGQTESWDLLVSNNKAHSVTKFDAETGAHLGDLVPPLSGGLAQTQEVLLGKDGNLLVAGIGPTAILSYDPRTGEFLGEFTSGYNIQSATKTRFGPDGNLYVSQWGTSQTSVAVFDGTTGVFIREATPNIDRPMGQAWDSEGTLYVTSFGSKDVRKYDDDGNQIGIVIPGTGLLQGPVNIWFEGDELRVIDWSGGTIQRYTKDGEHLGVFAQGLQNPEGWAYGPDGALYVAQWNGVGVRKLDPETGQIIGSVGATSGLQSPNDVFFLPAHPTFTLATTDEHPTISGTAGATVSVQVLPDRGLSFDEPVTISCSALSPRVSCAASPATVTPGLDSANVSVSFTKVAAGPPAVPTPESPKAPTPWWLLLGAVAAAALTADARFKQSGSGAHSSSGAHRRGRLGYAGFGTAAAFVALIAGCSEKPIEPDPVIEEDEITLATVTAVGDGLEQTLTLSVTIKP